MSEPVWWHSSGWLLIFVLVTAFLGMVTGVIKWLFPNVDREKERLNSIKVAQEIASCSHRVTNIKVYPHPGMIRIEMRADNDAMEESGLVFSHKHPDSEVLARVEKLAILQFDFQELPIENVEKQDLTAYLRLRC